MSLIQFQRDRTIAKKGINTIKNTKKDEFELSTLEETKQELILYYEKFKTANNSILKLCEENDVESHLKIGEETYLSFSKKRDELNKFIRLRKQDQNERSVNMQKEETIINLPLIELKKFGGNTMDWLAFRDLFISAVHNKTSLTNGQKFQYLKSSLYGDAERLINSFALTNNNYKEAWGLLNDRYDKQRELINTHIGRLINQPKISNPTKKAILNLIDHTNECIRTLAVLEQKVEGFSDKILVYIIQGKLDEETKRWWEREIGKDEIPTLNKLLEFLEKQARTTNIKNEESYGKQQIFSNPSFQKTNKPIQSSGTQVFTFPRKCSICYLDNHNISQCNAFNLKSVSERTQIVKDKKLCWNCLGLGHYTSQCRSKNTCRKCNQTHHTLLHDEGKNRSAKIRFTKQHELEMEENNAFNENLPFNYIDDFDNNCNEQENDSNYDNSKN
jgi:hypothetical protein